MFHVNPAEVQKVLIIRIDKVGDLLLSTPAIRSIRDSLPGAELTLLAAPYNASVLEGWDALDKIMVYDRSWPSHKKRAFAANLGRQSYDMCVVLSPVSCAYHLAKKTGARVRAGILYSGRIIPRLLAPFLLTHPLVFNIDRAVKNGAPVLHEVEQMLELVRFTGLSAAETPLEVPVTGRDAEWAQHIIAEHGMAENLIGLHLSFKWLSSGWTAEDMAGLFKMILDAVPGSSLLVTYGPAEADAICRFENYYRIKLTDGNPCLIATDKGKILLAGNLPFGRWAGLLQKCRLVVSPDTGSLHLAAALGKPVVALYERDTFNHCSSQWSPWKVPSSIIARSDFNTTSAKILQGIRQLYDDA